MELTHAHKSHKLPTDGAVAQLGERLNGIQKVVGSIPISSTHTSAMVRSNLELTCLRRAARTKPLKARNFRAMEFRPMPRTHSDSAPKYRKQKRTGFGIVTLYDVQTRQRGD